MTYFNHFRDKRKVGYVANLVCISLLGTYLSHFVLRAQESWADSKVVLMILGGPVLVGVLLLLISSRRLTRNLTQSIPNIIGKSIALLYSALTIGSVVFAGVRMKGYGDWWSLFLAAAVLIYTPYSFYLLNQKTSQFESTTSQTSDRVRHEEHQLNPSDLKLPPDAWS